MAAQVTMAFSSAAFVRIFWGVRSSRIISTMRRPLICAIACRWASTAGMLPLKGRLMPMASTRHAIVDAVPMVMQVPRERDMQRSAPRKSAADIFPARTASLKRHTSVPLPMSRPLNLPLSIGPLETTIAGSPTLAAPISCPGVVLSQPPSSTTPSTGLPRMDSSTSIASRLRQSIAVGRIWVSPRLMAGNSRGTPPASQTPRLT